MDGIYSKIKNKKTKIITLNRENDQQVLLKA